MEAKITVKLWESEIQAGAFCDQVNQIYSKNVCGGYLPPLPDFLFCYAFEIMNTTIVLKLLKPRGLYLKKWSFYVLDTILLNVKILWIGWSVYMWCGVIFYTFFLNTKTIAKY